MSQRVSTVKSELNICALNTDASLVFDTSDPMLSFRTGIDFGLLMVQAGAFPSVKRAWAQDYKGPVPGGWTSFRVGEREFNLWNPGPWESPATTQDIIVD